MAALLCRSFQIAFGQLGLVQVPNLVQMAKTALEEGKCVVIGLQSTGEARTADVVAERGEELDDFVSGPKVRLKISCCFVWFLCSEEKLSCALQALG